MNCKNKMSRILCVCVCVCGGGGGGGRGGGVSGRDHWTVTTTSTMDVAPKVK